MKHRKAISLVEMLVVVAILAILAAIITPIIVRAKLNAKKTACLSNMRQASLALSLYIESNGDYPMAIMPPNHWLPSPKKIRITSPIATYSKNPTRIFLCPLDNPEGRTSRPRFDRVEPRSYAETWFLWEGEQGVAAWRRLESLESNPILFRCYFHEDRTREELLSLNGSTRYGLSSGSWAQAVRKDGSVFYDRRPHQWVIETTPGLGRSDVKRAYWTATTNVPCPPDICDGQDPPEFNREG